MIQADRLRVVPLRDAAAYVGLTPAGLYDQRLRNVEPGSLGYRVGNRVVFDLADLDAYLDRAKHREQVIRNGISR